jgi:hypothetical protein
MPAVRTFSVFERAGLAGAFQVADFPASEDSNRFTHARFSQTLHFRPFEGFANRRLTQCPQTALTIQPLVGTRWRIEALAWLLMGWSQWRVSLMSDSSSSRSGPFAALRALPIDPVARGQPDGDASIL